MTRLLPLSRWFEYPDDHRVASNLGRALSKRDLEQRVGAWIEALEQRPGERFAVFHSDTFEFLAILLALWHLGRVACIASDDRPATVTRLRRQLDGLAGEFPSDGDVIEATERHARTLDGWREPDAARVALSIYTSGSTGEPKSIDKTIEQLQQELVGIETLWPGRGDNVVLATVSHQHIYGMTFGLFWPLASGRAFESSGCELIEDILYRAVLYPRFALVSSPSHLARFGAARDWTRVAGHCDYVVSSAAPLAREDSLRVAELLRAPVREIYGSSETGAIAWRVQADRHDDAAWQPLPGAVFEMREDSGAVVRAPWLGAADCFDLPDRLRFEAGGGFRLLGRADSIVKVEGKRVSLAAIEKRLAGHAWIRLARAVVIERARVETAVVAQLSEAGEQALQQQGRRPVIDQLRSFLRQEFEAVVVPRRWRFVAQMPYNRQGKLPLDSLRAMFVREPLSRPAVLRRETADGTARLTFSIPRGLVYFDGHMPGQPVLPGIVQVHWAELYGRELLSVQGEFQRLEAVKFQQVIRPDYEVELELVYDVDGGKLKFRFASERGVHSSGRICFAGR